MVGKRFLRNRLYQRRSLGRFRKPCPWGGQEVRERCLRIVLEEVPEDGWEEAPGGGSSGDP